jgi:hypothetical protein
MAAIEAKDILDLAIERASAVNTYWNLFIGVATGVVGVMASGKAFTTSRTLKVFLSLAFALFAYSNLEAILALGRLRDALLQILPSEFPNRNILIENLKPADAWKYITFHGVLDAIVLGAIWLVPWPSSEK